MRVWKSCKSITHTFLLPFMHRTWCLSVSWRSTIFSSSLLALKPIQVKSGSSNSKSNKSNRCFTGVGSFPIHSSIGFALSTSCIRSTVMILFLFSNWSHISSTSKRSMDLNTSFDSSFDSMCAKVRPCISHFAAASVKATLSLVKRNVTFRARTVCIK